MTILAVRALSKHFGPTVFGPTVFGPTVAVDGIDFDLTPGAITDFLGSNGAGKTTTLRMILGLVQPTSGTATFDGQPYHRLAQPASVVGAVLDGPQHHPGRRGRDHLRILAAAAGLSPRRVEEVLDLVELGPAAQRRVGGYSLGMRQRLTLAAALLGDPDVLILDEPTNGLDPQGVRWLRGLLRCYADHGRTVLIASHLLAEAAQIVDEVIVIGRGWLLAHGPTSELLARHGAADLEALYLHLIGTPETADVR